MVELWETDFAFNSAQLARSNQGEGLPVITAVLPVRSTPLRACRAVDLEPRIGAMVIR